jgi:uncharacterized RDD family membrane protein YckC
MSLELEETVALGGGTFTDAGRPAVVRGDSLKPGAMLAHFRIDALLGAGGMGEVYRATDLALDRPVALKVLPTGVAQDAGRRDRLFREARSQARLQHPNVCHIYYVGVQDGIVFFAMELVAGETLAERVARGPISAEEAVEAIRQAALGLREAQRHGFTHRDVKPSNLMLDREGRVKVVDFGLVTGGDVADAPDADLAKTGLVGTPLYMAPEQAAGGTLDARADIYALGATLHHLVSGRPPFEADSRDALETCHRSTPRPRLAVAGRRARALASIDAVVARMMAKSPDDRFADYDSLIHALERISLSRTRPAGLVVRTIAVLFDLALVALCTLPVLVLTSLTGYHLTEENVLFLILAPAYTVILLPRFGTTFGRWVFDIEVVSIHDMSRPSRRAAAIRFLAEYGAVSLGILFGLVGIRPLAGLFFVLGMLFGPLELLRASALTTDKRTLWDRASGTMVRYR